MNGVIMSEKKKILYAEDDSLTRTLIAKKLARIADVKDCDDGEKAFDEFSRGEFDLLVTDLAMPNMTGQALISKVREKDKTIPIIVTTAYRNNYEIESNVETVLEKPIDTHLLLAQVKNFLGKKR